MANVLVVAEFSDKSFRKVSYEMAGMASEIAEGSGGQVSSVVLGDMEESQLNELGKYGVNTIFFSNDNKLKNYLSDLYSEIIVSLVKEHKIDLVLLAVSIKGKDLAAVLAAKLDAGLATDCISFSMDGDSVIYKRPIYSGKAIATVKIKSNPQIATIRPNTLEIKEKNIEAEVNKLEIPSVPEKIKVLEVLPQKSERIDATEASIVISGGRGMKGAEGFKIIEDLADLLGAGIGASRAATDAGWIPYQFQIGQTGKVVSPNIYIACGISGAIQHLAGMGSSKYIVAVNKDPEAPIFKAATFGIVSDLHEFIPAFTNEVKKHRE